MDLRSTLIIHLRANFTNRPKLFLQERIAQLPVFVKDEMLIDYQRLASLPQNSSKTSARAALHIAFAHATSFTKRNLGHGSLSYWVRKSAEGGLELALLMQDHLERTLCPTRQNDNDQTLSYNKVLRHTIKMLAKLEYSHLPESSSTYTFATLRIAAKSLGNEVLAAHYAVAHQLASIVPAGFVNAPHSSTGETPLLLACRLGDYTSARILLDHGADPLIRSADGCSPLHWLFMFDDSNMSDIASQLQCFNIGLIAGRPQTLDAQLPVDLHGTPLEFAVASASASAVGVLLLLSENSLGKTIDLKQAWCRASSLYLTDVLLVLRAAYDLHASSHVDMRDLGKSSSIIKKLIHGCNIELARVSTVRLLLTLDASEDTTTTHERLAATATSTRQPVGDLLSFSTLLTRAIPGLKSAIQLGDLALTEDIIQVLSGCSGSEHAAELSDVLGLEITTTCAMTACTSLYDLDGPIELLTFSAHYGRKLMFKDTWAVSIIAAIQHRRQDIFRWLWRNPEDVNARTKDGATILTTMLKANFTGLVSLQTILSSGADPDLCDGHQTPPILLALQLGMTHDFEVLLAHGASVSVKDQDGNALLHVAVKDNRLWAVSILLEHPGTIALVSGLDESSRTSLPLTASEGFPQIVDLALETDKDQKLLSTMCSAKTENYINCRNYHGYSPFHVAIIRASEEGDPDLAICQQLLAAGADPNMESSTEELPLFMALRLLSASFFLKLLPLLLRYGVDIDTRACSLKSSQVSRSPTALQIAAYHGAAELAKGLLEHGATCNIIGNDNGDSLHFCAMELEAPLRWKSLSENRKDVTAKHLIEAGADILATVRRNEHGCRDYKPLDLALHENKNLNNSISIVLIQAHHAQLSGPVGALHYKILQEVFEDAVESESPLCFLPKDLVATPHPAGPYLHLELSYPRHLRKRTVIDLFLLARIPVNKSALCTPGAMPILASALASKQANVLECYMEQDKSTPTFLNTGNRRSLWDKIKKSSELWVELNRCLSYLDWSRFVGLEGVRAGPGYVLKVDHNMALLASKGMDEHKRHWGWDCQAIKGTLLGRRFFKGKGSNWLCAT